MLVLEEDGDYVIEQELDLDIVPLAMQVLLDMGALTKTHPAYQSMFHLVVGALGGGDDGYLRLQEFKEHAHGFDTLVSLQQSIQLVNGKKATNMLRGSGSHGGFRPSCAADYLGHRNFGCVSESTITRSLPPRYKSPGVQIEDVLNLFEMLESRGAFSYTPPGWSPAQKKTFVVAGMTDEMMLGKALQLDERSLTCVGLENDLSLEQVKAFYGEDGELDETEVSCGEK
jgi:hypothetical protein